MIALSRAYKSSVLNLDVENPTRILRVYGPTKDDWDDEEATALLHIKTPDRITRHKWLWPGAYVAVKEPVRWLVIPPMSNLSKRLHLTIAACIVVAITCALYTAWRAQ